LRPLPQCYALLTGEREKNVPFSSHLRAYESLDVPVEVFLQENSIAVNCLTCQLCFHILDWRLLTDFQSFLGGVNYGIWRSGIMKIVFSASSQTKRLRPPDLYEYSTEKFLV